MYLKVLFYILFASGLFANSLKVAVCANARFAFDEIAKKYESKTGIKIDSIVSSSGQLTAQIEHGAPFDIFLSADMKYPNYLYEKGVTISKPKIYAYGGLALWSRVETIDKNLEILKNTNVQKIAIANPKNAPYGKEALKLLKKYNTGKKILSKLVFANSISQTNQYIYSRSVDVAITSSSTMMLSKMRENGKWLLLEKENYSPIEQGIVILKHGYLSTNKESADFYKYIFSDEARRILRNYGYTTP